MTTECDGEQTCQDIVDDLKADLDIYCEGFDAAYSDFTVSRRAFWDSRIQAGQAWQAVQAASTAHRAARATKNDAKAVFDNAKAALRVYTGSSSREDQICVAECRIDGGDPATC